MRRARSAAHLLTLALGAGSAHAATVEHCTLPMAANLGRLVVNETDAPWFARLGGGGVSIGSAKRLHIHVAGCSPSANYRLWLGSSIQASNGFRVIALTPVITAVDGIPRNPQPMVGPANALELSGNPDLEIVFAIDPAALPLPAGRWSGNGQATFEDR